jgi:hypothetical protein
MSTESTLTVVFIPIRHEHQYLICAAPAAIIQFDVKTLQFILLLVSTMVKNVENVQFSFITKSLNNISITNGNTP